MQAYHLYSDGNSFPRAKKSGFGGYIESPQGEVLVEYTEQIKQPEYFHSFELLGIIRGLQIAQSKGIENIVSHCDDKNTASKLKEIFEDKIYNISPNIKPELFEEIINLSKSFKTIKFEYIPRAQNKHADSLSRKYAVLMEGNFLKQYDDELNFSQRKFEAGIKTNKRIFFAHKSIIKNPNKNNPFLVANLRNKKVRKVSREQQHQTYDFLFTEFFSQNDNMIIRHFHYDKNYQLLNTIEKKFDINESHVDCFCNSFIETLNTIKKQGVDKLWISSNYRIVNGCFEQKEKLPNNQWDNFLKIHNELDGFECVFFHNLPFDHTYSKEIAPIEKVKEKIGDDIGTLDELIEQLSQSDFIKDQGKCFGAIIRHQLRNYKVKLERDLDDIEINEIIEQTVTTLNEKGYTNLPFKNKNK